MTLSEYSIRKPITTIMVALSVIVLGWISLFRLPLEYLPDLTFPSISIEVNYPSSSPEEIERNITRPIEDAMGTLSGVKGLRSSSYGSRASIRVEFDYSVDMDLASVHIRDRLDQVRNLLPGDVERIQIRRFNLEDLPILEYAVSWAGEDPGELASVYKQVIHPRLQRIEGVGSVEIEGMAERALFVHVDQNLLNAHGLDIRRLSNTIRNNNRNISAGYVTDAGMARSISRFNSKKRTVQHSNIL